MRVNEILAAVCVTFKHLLLGRTFHLKKINKCINNKTNLGPHCAVSWQPVVKDAAAPLRMERETRQ